MLRTDVYVTADLYQAKQQDKPGPSVMAEGHAVWRATSRRENLGYFESELWLNPKGEKEAPALVLFHPTPN